MKTLIPTIFLFLTFSLAACTGGATTTAQPAATATTTPSTPPPTPLPVDVFPTVNEAGEILNISGNGPDSSYTFTVDTETHVRVMWEQSSTGNFELYIRGLDANLAGTAYEKVLFEKALGPSSGYAYCPFPPGTYQVDITQSDGPWHIWIVKVILQQ